MAITTRRSQQDREADTVRSRPTREGYHCPSKQKVLDHLATVQLRLRDPKLTAERRSILADDLDALLSRLSYWLTVEATPADEAQTVTR